MCFTSSSQMPAQGTMTPAVGHGGGTESFQQGAHTFSGRYAIVASMIPVVGVLLILAGCAITGARAMRQEIQHKAEVRAELDRAMLPALPESTAAVWWGANGGKVMGAVATALSAAYAAWKTQQGKAGTT